MTKLSVIVAAYNVAEYIEECLHSMINQTLKEVEFIIVDDGSTDETSKIIKKWLDTDNRLKLVTHQKNKGLMLARKTGYDMASGEYIMFLDGDDSLDFKACETAYNAIKKAKVDILQFGANVFGDKDVIEKCSLEIKGVYEYLKPLDMKIFSPKTGGLLVFNHSKDKINLSIWNKIYKKSIVDKVSEVIPDEHIIMSEDVLFSYIACFFAKSYYSINMKLYNYRYGNGISTTNEISDRRIQSIAKCSYVYNFLKEWTQKQGCTEICKSALNRIELQIYDSISYTLLNKIPKKKRQNFVNDVLKHFTTDQLISSFVQAMYLNGGVVSDKLAEICADLDVFKTTKKKIKTVAVFYYRMYNGGVENVLSQLTDIWVKNGYRVILYTTQEANEKDYYINSSVTRIVLPEYKYGIIKSFEERISFLRRSLLEHNVDAFIYNAWLDPNLIADAMIVKSLGIPFIVHTHGTFCADLTSLDQIAAYKNATLHKVYNFVDMVVGLSNTDVTYWNSLGLNCIKTTNPVPWSFDTETSSLSGKNIVMVCRISNEKQIHDALKIIQNVINKIPEATLTIVGDGDDKLYIDSINIYIQDNKLENAVNMVGFKKDVLPYYQAADVMLITSRFEGFCLSLVESKICGLPLVTYDLPNVDTVRSGKGMFVVSQNDIDGATEKIVQILSDDDLKRKMGAEARKSAEELLSFDLSKHWDYIFEQTLNPSESMVAISSSVCATINTLCHYTAQGLLLRIKEGIITEEFSQSAARIADLENTVKEIRRSTSYRLGWFLTTIPRKIKDFIKGQKYVE